MSRLRDIPGDDVPEDLWDDDDDDFYEDDDDDEDEDEDEDLGD